MRGRAGQRLGLALQLLQLAGHRGVAGQTERMRAGQQPVQHHAQLPEVGGGGDRRVVQLLRRCVLEGQRAVVGGGDLAALQLLGDAEVQQLDPAVAVHQQVGGLEVAVHHQVAVRVADRVQHLQEQHHALAQAQLARVAPAVDRHAVDPLHHEIRLALCADAAVQQGGDIGMLQAGQDLALAQEAFARHLRVRAAADQLERGLLRVGAVVALDQVDGAHAAAAQDADHAPCADARADQAVAFAFIRTGQCFAPGRRAIERIGGGGIGGE